MTGNVAGRPNISNPALDENGRHFSDVWYKLFLQLWIRSGGSDDDVTDLRDAIELIELIPNKEIITEDDLSPQSIQIVQESDLSPQYTQVMPDFDLAPV
jgi:hypothetical protein